MRNIIFITCIIFTLFACNEGGEGAKMQENTTETKEIKNIQPDPSNNKMIINADDIILGDKNSKIVLIEYFSPTCPHCAYYRKEVFPEIEKKYINTNKIAYVIREFIANKQDFDAALLARCADSTELTLKFINVILGQQNSWATNSKYRDLLTNIGQLGGVSAEEYAKCLVDEKLGMILMNNSRIVSKEKNFVGTPAFFLNGEQLLVPHSLNALSDVLDKETAKPPAS